MICNDDISRTIEETIKEFFYLMNFDENLNVMNSLNILEPNNNNTPKVEQYKSIKRYFTDPQKGVVNEKKSYKSFKRFKPTI